MNEYFEYEETQAITSATDKPGFGVSLTGN